MKSKNCIKCDYISHFAWGKTRYCLHPKFRDGKEVTNITLLPSFCPLIKKERAGLQ